MKTVRFLAFCTVLWVLGPAVPAPAAADSTVVAGWDFSQYLGPNVPSIDGINLADTLDANYSDFDPSFGAGAESAAFGTMYADGTNGSSAIGASGPLVPTGLQLTLNVSAPVNDVPAIDVPFNSFSVLDTEGQPNQTAVAMIAQAATDVVFEADLSTAGGVTGDFFGVSFAGRTASTGTADVVVEFNGGSGFSTAETVTFTTTEQLFEVPLGSSGADQVFVRLSFADRTVDGADAVFDNLVITVPGPGWLAGMLSPLAALGLLARRRRGRL